ncbi:MAG: DUF1302 family protein [Candidatus Binatia bacterium]
MRGAGLLAVIGACVLGSPVAQALEATVAGRQVTFQGTFSVREVIEENGATKHERTREQLRVRAGVSLADWLRFDSTTVATNGGPTLKSDRASVYSLDDVFQDVSPAVEFDEAYFDVFLPSVDLRIGKQKVAWGKLDRGQPNDLINPLDYSDPFVEEQAERKIGVPALQASYYPPAASFMPPESRLTAVWVPQYIPYRFPLASCPIKDGAARCDAERWFPPAGVPVTDFGVPAGLIPLPNGGSNPAFSLPLSFRTQNAPTPALRLENNEIGLRYSALIHNIDFALYYFHGFDVTPAFRLTAEALGVPDPDPNNPLHVKDLQGATVLVPEFRHIDAWGADFAYAFDRFTVRGEGAFVRGRPFSRDLRSLITDPRPLAGEIAKALGALANGAGRVPVALPPSFVVHDAVEWGLGGDYVYAGYLLLLQVNQTDVLRNNVDLLIEDVETRLLANLRKSFLSDTLQTQLVAAHAIESDYTFLRPRIRYWVTDHLAAEAGYLFIAGRAQSVVGQYRRNDEGWFKLEYKL